MDPTSQPASASSASQSEPASAREKPRKDSKPQRGGRSAHKQQQPPAAKESSAKNKGSNHQRKENSKEKGDLTASSVPHPRVPRTITATDPINLHADKPILADGSDSRVSASAVEDDDSVEQHSCFICTENIVIFAVSDCNHRTCHLCSLRLRALYKTKNCAYCKADQGIMTFTRDATKLFQDYDLKAMAFFDRKLNIYFEDQEMYEDTMVLLRFNCPDPTCEVACPDGWNQLKSHVKKVHKLMLCDLCVRYKKVFAHEHNLMTASQLMRHFKNGDSGQSNQNSAEPSGFKGHPECGFCKESFYGDDELFDHCKKNHEQCFLCLRRNIRHQYYDKYLDLERHLHSEHYACMDPECLEKKFVVFDSELDLKAHEAEMHPNSTHGQRTRQRDARKIEIAFNYQPAGESSGSRRTGRGNRQTARDQGQGQGRSRQDDDVPRQPQLTPHQIQQISLQQQIAQEQERRNNSDSLDATLEELSDLSLKSSPATTPPLSAPSPKTMLRTRPPAGFGAALTAPTTSAASLVAANIQRTTSPLRPSRQTVVTPSSTEWPAVSATVAHDGLARSQSPLSSNIQRGSDVPNDTLSKHAALQERVQRYLQGSAGSLPQFRTLTTQYRNSQIPANQYVASLSSLFGSDLEKSGKVIQGVYDVLDSESKKSDMMKAWRDFKTVQTQFPSLESMATSNPTMADIATPSTRRVLVIKSSGTTRGGLGHTKPKSTATWDRAAAAAASMSRTGSPMGSSSASTPMFYPTPQLNSSAAWTLPRSSGDKTPEPIEIATSGSNAGGASAANRTQGATGWAGISQSSGQGSSAPQFRPTAISSRPPTAADQFPSLVGQAPVGVRPSLGLLPASKNKSVQDDAPNGWVTGWSSLSADQFDAEEDSSSGKKKKNKKKILFHVG
ncbi:hypothetical protein BGZ99_007779 [Dissophora globulifera]|uniref:RING-type E3 ubiquitin transferase n=1 Tax=Dissophora globulifera TaxID=979702 RepID=A0A9P6UQ58_9FUNG|nr:hypothetical protein BGZ99_007779 [Dissophora globulifera]